MLSKDQEWALRASAGLVLLCSSVGGCSVDENKYHFGPSMAGASGASAVDGNDGGGGTGNLSSSGGSGPGCFTDEVRCDGLSPQRCSEDGHWLATQADCALACFQGECAACATGETTCRDGAVQTCVAGAWTTLEVCENVCEQGICVDACKEDSQQCNGTRTLQKCVNGEFVDDTECDVLCSDGACTGVCLPDARRCNPATPDESQVCSAEGNWSEGLPCASGTFCVEGNCKSCRPGTARCSDLGPQLCSEAGEWVNQGACTSPKAVCFEEKCVSCSPGDKRCGDHTVERCSADGSTWEELQACSGNTPVCLESSKACGQCAQGDAQCLSDQVQTCDGQGVLQTTQTCSELTPQCVGGKCTACDPAAGERRCASPTSTQTCNTNGTWAAATPCSSDTPQCREALGFTCGCEEGARRCRNTTVPEQCQGGAWVAQSACAGTLDYCLPATGQCVDCVPNAAECRNGIAQQCSSAGAFVSLNSCSGPGINCGKCSLGDACSQNSKCKTGFCVNSKCAACQPGARDCSGATPRLCSTQGVWTNQTACTGSTPECLASTGLCVACLNGASRSCGNCNTGTQTCSSNQWGTCIGAVDLETSKQYCGTCTNSCSASQLCENGACVTDCGTLTRCGTACVNLATDMSNCLSCGTKCSPPASNGTAECTATGCDISCTNTRCGTSCCGATPARSTAGCSGNTCTFACSTGNHGCGGSTPPCYANADATHCGSSCRDCSAYTGTTGVCASDQCTCEVSSLACAAGVPTCGNWDFDSNTVEGWRLGDWDATTNHHWVSDSFGTAITNGSPALTAKYDGVAAGGGSIEFEVDLCLNGAILNLSNYTLTYDFYFLTTGGTRFSPGGGSDSLLASGSSVLTSCQPFVEPGVDQWLQGSCSNLPSSATNLTIVFRINVGWAGTVFLDNVKFTPK